MTASVALIAAIFGANMLAAITMGHPGLALGEYVIAMAIIVGLYVLRAVRKH